MRNPFRPRLVREPITGGFWMARCRADVALAWLPALLVLAALGLGFFAGRVTAWWWA